MKALSERWDSGWPEEMVVGVREHPLNLLTLLFVRSVLGFDAGIEIPELDGHLLADPASVAPSTSGVQSQWEREWKDSWLYIETQVRLASTGEESILPLGGSPVSSLDSWGLDAHDFDLWRSSLRTGSAETSNLWGLNDGGRGNVVEAWRQGFMAIVVLPYRGYFSRRPRPSLLEISTGSMRDPKRLSEALAELF